jgi:hypothetical protein
MERGVHGRTYFLAGPVHTLEGALDLAAEITGVAAPTLKLPPRVLRVASILVRPFERLAPLPSASTSEGLRIIAGVTYIGTSARAERELAWRPRPLRDGLTETLRHEMALLNLSGPSGRQAADAGRAP